MAEAVTFPVYVLTKDCGEVREFSSPQAMQRYLEAIDVENDEYEAWDSNGQVLRLGVGPGKSEWLQIVKTGSRLPDLEFAAVRAKADLG